MSGPSTALRPTLAYLCLLGALAVSVSWHANALLLPPHAEHSWRDADGIGVARGFLEPDAQLFYPRLAQRGAGTGVTGMELPVVNWLSAQVMRVAGPGYGAARSVVWLSVLLLGAGVFALGRRVLGSNSAGALAAAFAVLQPLVVIFSRKLMPEVPMLAVLAWACAFAWDGLRGAWPKALLGGLLFALAAVMKPTGAAAGVAVACWAFQAGRGAHGNTRWSAAGRLGLLAGLPLLAASLWYAHARALNVDGMFKLEHDWFEWVSALGEPNFWTVVIGRFFHLILLWPTVALLLWRWRTAVAVAREHWPLLLWCLSAVLLIVLFGRHNYKHAYYSIGLCLPVALLVGGTVERIASASRAPKVWWVAFTAITAVTSMARTDHFFAPPPFDVPRLEAALPRLGPPGPTVVTDRKTPVESLVILRRTGWTRHPEELTLEGVKALREEGAVLLIESSFGGWLPEETRAALGAPVYADEQVRSYALGAQVN